MSSTDQSLRLWREEAFRLSRQLAQPPEGWFTFGSHIDQDVALEFWGDDGCGLPIWERPVGEVR